MVVNSEDSIDAIRVSMDGQQECKISCRKDDNVWNITVYLYGEDIFDMTVINEKGFPLEAISNLMESYSRLAS